MGVCVREGAGGLRHDLCVLFLSFLPPLIFSQSVSIFFFLHLDSEENVIDLFY